MTNQSISEFFQSLKVVSNYMTREDVEVVLDDFHTDLLNQMEETGLEELEDEQGMLDQFQALKEDILKDYMDEDQADELVKELMFVKQQLLASTIN